MLNEQKINNEIENHYNQIKRSKAFLFSILVLILTGIALFTFSFFMKIPSDLLGLLLFSDLFLIIIASLYWYLQVQPIDIYHRDYEESVISDKLYKQLENINEIEEAISIYSTSIYTDEKSEKDVIDEIVKFISSKTEIFGYSSPLRKFDANILINRTSKKLFQLSLKTLKKSLIEQKDNANERSKNKTEEDSNKDKSLDRMTKLVDMVTSRLRTEIAQLSRRSDIYIIFGSGITLIAGAFLYFTVQDLLTVYKTKNEQSATGLTMADLFSVFIRFSIVIFIEVFAFYYLRLYKNIMENIKYYQNEITNIEMKILSLHALENGKCNESLKNFTMELSKTERNFVIDKNKTTIDLERSKLESDFFKSSTDNFVKLVKSVKA